MRFHGAPDIPASVSAPLAARRAVGNRPTCSCRPLSRGQYLRAKPESEAYGTPKLVFRPWGFAAPLVVPPARGEARVLPAVRL